FAYNPGLPKKTAGAPECLFGNSPHTIDVGMVTDDKGRSEYWDNTIGLGFSGAVNIASRKIENLRGFLVYLIAVLQTIIFKPQALQAVMQIDGQPDRQQPIAMISICN